MTPNTVRRFTLVAVSVSGVVLCLLGLWRIDDVCSAIVRVVGTSTMRARLARLQLDDSEKRLLAAIATTNDHLTAKLRRLPRAIKRDTQVSDIVDQLRAANRQIIRRRRSLTRAFDAHIRVLRNLPIDLDRAAAAKRRHADSENDATLRDAYLAQARGMERLDSRLERSAQRFEQLRSAVLEEIAYMEKADAMLSRSEFFELCPLETRAGAESDPLAHFNAFLRRYWDAVDWLHRLPQETAAIREETDSVESSSGRAGR